MSDKTLKVQPWGEGQGDFVVIDADSFDENFHTLFGETANQAKDTGLTANQAKERLEALGVTYKASASKADLLALLEKAEADAKVVALKAALTERGIAFEDGATQEELQALLDAAE